MLADVAVQEKVDVDRPVLAMLCVGKAVIMFHFSYRVEVPIRGLSRVHIGNGTCVSACTPPVICYAACLFPH